MSWNWPCMPCLLENWFVQQVHLNWLVLDSTTWRVGRQVLDGKELAREGAD